MPRREGGEELLRLPIREAPVTPHNLAGQKANRKSVVNTQPWPPTTAGTLA
jgi:hypothetical protein